jgi:predicted XRE-type DNA-binding protein
MSHWVSRINTSVDFDVLEESALAMAQSAIQNAINDAGITKADLARQMGCQRSVVSRMLSGNHNLTIRTMARALAACGSEVRFRTVPIEWNWGVVPQTPPREMGSAHAGPSMGSNCA